MKIDNTLEKNYILAIQKEQYKLTSFDKQSIEKRNNIIRNQFKFNQNEIKKLLLLNEKLIVEEKRIFLLYKKLIQQNELLIQNKEIEDFNIDIVLECWNNNYYQKIVAELDGNPFYKTDCNFMSFQDSAIYENLNFNDTKTNTLISEIDHCYTFHHLYDHTPLTWFDLRNIVDIWFEIKVDYQFFITI